MSASLTIPKLAMSMTEGTLVEWLVDNGAQVNEGQPIYVVEYDKSSMEIEAPASGTLTQTGEEGETYDVGTEIGSIG